MSAPDQKPKIACLSNGPYYLLNDTTPTPVPNLRRANGEACATVRGVANTPITAPTELPELRQLLSASDDVRVAQVILRLGYGDPCPATPRRPLSDVAVFTETANAF